MLPELTLAQKLSRLRGNRGLREVARAAGIAASTLHRMERGMHDLARSPQSITLRGETLRRLAKCYAVLPEYLTGDLRTYMRAWAPTALVDSSPSTSGARLQRLAAEIDLRYGIGTSALAAAIGVDEADLADSVAGRLSPTEVSLAKLEEVTGVPSDWVLGQQTAVPWGTDDYAQTIHLAMSSGVPPDVMADLVRTWLSKQHKKT